MDKVVWTNEYMEKFGLAFIKYEPLYHKPKTNSLDKGKKRVKISDCHKQLARELGWRSFRKSSIVHQCVTFKKKFTDMLRQLVWEADEAPAEEVLRAAPVWVRTVEAALHCVPTIKAEASSSTWSSPKAVALLASRLATQMAREALRRRSVRADALAPARARLAALTAHRLDADAVHDLWERVQRVALGKLALSAAAGDDALGVAEGARLEPHDWLVLDALLLYADTDVTGAESYLLYEQLQPLVDVFHLVQMHHLEDPDHPEPLAVRWTRAYNNYAAKGLSASLVLLQRRWFELKLWARRGVLARWRRRADCQLYPLHVAVAKRFPHVVTGPLPRWEELVAAGQVVVEPVDLGEADANKHPPDNPVSSQGLNENYIETEDDLILIEENIETVDLEDEDDVPDDVKNINDEAVKNAIDPDNTTECIEVIVVNEGSKESSSVKNVKAEKDKEITDNIKTAGEITDNTKTAGEITDTTETGQLIDNTLTVVEKIDNTRTAGEITDNTKTAGEITDTTETGQIIDNTLTVVEKIDNTKTAGEITDNTKTAGEITDTTETGQIIDNTLTVVEKIDNTKTAGEITDNTKTAGEITDTTETGQIIDNTLTVVEKIDNTKTAGEITDTTNTGEIIDNTIIVGEKIENTKTAGEITDNTKAGEITNSTLTEGEKIDITKTVGEITDNTKTAGEITDTTKTGEITDNTLTVGEKIDNTKTTNVITDNTKTAGEIIENTLKVGEKVNYTKIVAEITDNTNEETDETLDNDYDDDDDNDMQIDDTCIETPAFLDSIEDSLSNIESNKYSNTVPPTTETTSKDSTQKDGVDNMNTEPEKQEYIYEMSIEKEPKMIGINTIKEKAEQEIAILSKLEQLDPDKVQTEITFESDSDFDISRGASPLPSTSEAKDSNIMSDEDSAEDSNKESDIKEDEDVGSKIVNENTVKVKKEINESKSEDTNLSRFLFVDDVNTVENSDISEDELCIADIKRRKKSETLKNRIQFECEDMIQKESNDANVPTTRQRTFALNIIPLSDLNEIDQSDIQNFLNQEKKHEAPEDNVNFNFGENIRAMSATALGERRTSKATKRIQGCSEDRGKRKRRQTDDDSESESEEGGGGGGGRRAPKRVQLPDIEQVRRANGRTPTAQVPPLAPAPPTPRPRRSARQKTTDVKDEETAKSSITEKQEKTDKRKSRDNATTKVCEEDASTPNQRELFQFLENIADTSRGVAQQRRSGAKVAYCCAARRHRAVNDARRRLAAKAGHARPPPPLPLHSGAHLRECACCCLHLVEELRRDEEVAAEQRALRGDLAGLLLGRRAGAKLTPASHLKPPSNKSKTQDNKDEDSNESKIEEKEGNNSADPNESSELDSDNDTDLIIDTGYSEESSDKVISNDEDKLVTSRARRKKKADTKEDAVTQNKVSDTGEKTHTDPENDPGYQEWIRQKNLTTKFFGLGPPKENEDKPKYSNKKDNLSNQISMNCSVESNKQNLVSVDKTIEETVPRLDDQVTATNNHIDGNGPFASVKITSISGGVVSNFNIASAPNSPRVQETPMIHQISQEAIQNENSTTQMSDNLFDSVANHPTNLPLSACGMIGPAVSAPLRLPPLVNNIPTNINFTNNSTISGVVTTNPTGDKAMPSGKLVSDVQVNSNIVTSAPFSTKFLSIPRNIVGALIPVTVSDITADASTITKTVVPMMLPPILVQMPTVEKSDSANSIDCGTTGPNICFDGSTISINTRPIISTNCAGGPLAPNFGLNAPGTSTTLSETTGSTTAANGKAVSNILPKGQMVPCTVVSKPTTCSVATKEAAIPRIIIKRSTLRTISTQSLIASSATTGGQTVVSTVRGRPINSYITYSGPRAQGVIHKSPCISYRGPRAQGFYPRGPIPSLIPFSVSMTSTTVAGGPTASNTIPSRCGPIVMSKASVSSPIVVPGITPASRVMRRGDNSAPSEDSSEEKVSIGQKLNAALIAAEQRLKDMKDVKNLQLTIRLDNNIPSVNFKRKIVDVEDSGVQRKAPRKWPEVTHVEVTSPPTGPQRVTPGEKTVVKVTSLNVDSDSDVDEVEVVPDEEYESTTEETEEREEEVVPVPNTPVKRPGWSSILRRPSEAIEPLWSCLTVERFLEGRDPTTVRLLRVNIECCDRAYIFVTEAEHPVQNSAYCTLAPWRSVQRILFAVDEDEDWGASKAMPHLLGGGCSPDTLSLADKYYKKLSEKPLVYAQVFSMIAAAVDCRSLLMRGKPVWAYCKADGCLRPISMAALGPRNVGLMCDDNGAVQELVHRLNLISGVQPKESPVVELDEEEEQPPPEHEGKSTISNVIEVIEVESDDDVAIVE